MPASIGGCHGSLLTKNANKYVTEAAVGLQEESAVVEITNFTEISLTKDFMMK